MSIKKQSIAGIKWTTLSTIITTVSSLLKISVLARFLDKSDFGLMALVIFIIGFSNLFMDMGLTIAILHKQKISNYEYSSLYWINILFSIVLASIISLFSPLISAFYNEPELIYLIPIMASTIIIAGIGRQYKTIEQKHLNFKYISIVESIASLLSLGVAIILAVNNYGIYALVYSAILLQLIANFSFFIKGLKRERLNFHFSFRETKPFLKIGLFQVGGQIVNYINRDLDILIIGKLMGSEVLGGYSLAKELVRRPMRIINPLVTKVYSPILPKFQNAPRKLKRYFSAILHNVSIINAVVYGLIAILAPTIIHILYGSGFEDIYFVVVGFCLIIFLRSSGQIRILVITTGRTDLELYWNLLQLVFFPIVIFIGSLYSIYHIVSLIVVMQLILILPCWKIFYERLVDLSLKVYLEFLLNPLLISLLTFLLYYLFNKYLLIEAQSIYKQILFAFLLVLTLGIYSYFFSEEITNILKVKKLK